MNVHMYAYLINAAFAGFIGAVFSSKDSLNKFLKWLNLIVCCTGVALLFISINNGVVMPEWSIAVPLFSATMGLAFIYASGRGLFYIFTKLFCLVSILATITYICTF